MRVFLVFAVALVGLFPFEGAAHAGAAEVAALLAGASVPGDDADPGRGGALHRHNTAMSARWERFDAKVGAPLGAWAKTHIEPAEQVFYPFSGPDFSTAHTVYPSAERYVLAGLEPAGRVPDLTGSAERLDQLLGIFRKGLATFVKKGFFGTKEMRRSFERKQLVEGITGVLMLFAHHEGFTVSAVKPITVDAAGKVVASDSWDSVRLELDDHGRTVIVDYLQMDLSDGGLTKRPGATEFVLASSRAATFLKAASHLLQNRGFDVVRDAIVNHATSVLQDETGVGYAALSARFEVRLFGDYRRAHKLFGRRQGTLRDAYEAAKPEPLPFKIGYWKVAGSCLQYGHTRRQ